MIFQTEKQLKEVEGKLPEDKKAPIDAALTELKAAHAAKDVEGIDKGIEALNTALQGAAAEFQAAAQEAQGGADAGAAQPEANAEGDAVEDVDFEEVK